MLLGQRPFYRTGELDRARAHLSAEFWPHELTLSRRERGVAFRHNKVDLASLSINALQYGNEVDIDASPTEDCFLVKCTLNGYTQVEQSGKVIRTRPGMVCVMNPTDHIHIRLSRDHNQLTVRIDRAHMQAFLEQEMGAALKTPIVFGPSARQLSTGANSLGRMLLSLCRDVSQHPECFESARLSRQLEEMLIAAVLAELPHTHSRRYMEASTAGVPDRLAPVLRYVKANFREPIELRELAVIAGTSVRSLQMAFRKELGTTATGYIRGLRLEHARRLLTVGSGDVSVTDAALASGFSHLGKFSRYYRQRFQELPSATARGTRPN